jgi:hypothetical protein
VFFRVVTPRCTLRRALSNPKLLGTMLQGDSWQAWRVLLIAAMGERLTPAERVIFKQLTSREREPGERVNELAVVAGRRGGKSRALAVLGVYLAALCDHTDVLAPGERGVLLIVAQGSRTARVILDYARAALEATPALRSLIVASNSDAIELNNGVVLEVRWASFRALRGPTFIGALIDEAAFLWTDEAYANPDVEVRASCRWKSWRQQLVTTLNCRARRRLVTSPSWTLPAAAARIASLLPSLTASAAATIAAW